MRAIRSTATHLVERYNLFLSVNVLCTDTRCRSYALKTPNPKVRSLSGHKCPEKCLSGHVNPRCRSYALKTMENLLKFLQVGWEVETIRLATIILYTMAFTFPQPRDSVRSFPSTLYGGSGGRKLPPRSWKR